MSRGLRKKARWEKIRQAKALEREREKMLNVRPKYKAPEFTDLKPRPSRFVETESMRHVKELPSLALKPKVKTKVKKLVVRPRGWAAREAAAAIEIERKKKMVAPLFNKGGYQYVGDDAPPEIIQGLGRKL